MELLKLLGIVIVVVGFALKWDSILTIMAASIVTALIAGMDPLVFLQTIGTSFVSNRNMLICVVVFLLTGTLERNGLRYAARGVMDKVRNASAGMVLGAYGIFRVIFAAFNVGFGGVAGFVKPVVMPMAEASDETGGHKISERHRDALKGMASGMENVAWFFGQVLFVGTSGMLLVQGTMSDLGYSVELPQLAAIQIPVAIVAVLVTAGYYFLLDRKLCREDETQLKAEADAQRGDAQNGEVA
ncbi:DUF969 domain-containing protein [Olsenella urininfantis]|uniref:DUF969 domain-containing protein n=1 Tax=Olsenella urininfantis TaxID=1871033 RepID=UPI00098647B9|nr:DUF969 domain-containing protein [Olsenella urininfantis]